MKNGVIVNVSVDCGELNQSNPATHVHKRTPHIHIHTPTHTPHTHTRTDKPKIAIGDNETRCICLKTTFADCEL